MNEIISWLMNPPTMYEWAPTPPGIVRADERWHEARIRQSGC